MAYTVSFTSAQVRLVDEIFGAQVYNLKMSSSFYTMEIEGKDLSKWLNKVDEKCKDTDFNQTDICELYMIFADAFDRWELDKGCE